MPSARGDELAAHDRVWNSGDGFCRKAHHRRRSVVLRHESGHGSANRFWVCLTIDLHLAEKGRRSGPGFEKLLEADNLSAALEPQTNQFRRASIFRRAGLRGHSLEFGVVKHYWDTIAGWAHVKFNPQSVFSRYQKGL